MINFSDCVITNLIVFIPIVLSLFAVIVSFWNSRNHAKAIAVSTYLEMTVRISNFGRSLWQISKEGNSNSSSKERERAKRDFDFEMIEFLTILNDYCMLLNRKKINSLIKNQLISVIKKFLIQNLHESSLYKYIDMYWEADDEALQEIQTFCTRCDIPGFPNRPIKDAT